MHSPLIDVLRGKSSYQLMSMDSFSVSENVFFLSML